MTFAKRILSGSTDGKQIKVAAAATPGTLVHTAVPGTTDLDEIYLYAYNSDSVDREITIQWGGVASPDDEIKFTVPAKSGKYKLVDGEPLQNGQVVRAFAAAANVVMIGGYVNRIQ